MFTSTRRLLALAVVSLMTAAAQAQQATDYSKVEIKTTKLANDFFTLEG